MEGGDSLLLSIVDLEHGDQFGDLQDIAQALAQAAELDFSAGCAGRGVNAHQSGEPATIDITHAREVQHDLSAGSQYALEVRAQLRGFFAKHNAALTRYDRDSIGLPGLNLQAHLILREPPPVPEKPIAGSEGMQVHVVVFGVG